jgi:hypothetical protein
VDFLTNCHLHSPNENRLIRVKEAVRGCFAPAAPAELSKGRELGTAFHPQITPIDTDSQLTTDHRQPTTFPGVSPHSVLSLVTCHLSPFRGYAAPRGEPEKSRHQATFSLALAANFRQNTSTNSDEHHSRGCDKVVWGPRGG